MKAKLKKILPVIMSLLLMAAFAITLFCIGRLDVLPNRFFLTLIGATMIVWVVLTLLLVLPSKNGCNLRAVIACLVSFAIVCGCAVVSNMAGKLYRTMQIITNTTTVTTEYTVYVRIDDAANELNDIEKYSVGIYYAPGDESLDKALSSLENELGCVLNTVTFTNVPELINALYLGRIDAIVLDDGYVSILEETEIYADFSTRTKSIHNISVEETVTIPTQPSTEPSTNTNDGSETAENIEPFILYISGLDTRKPTLSKSRSDVNILVAVNPQTKQILLINTPRGFYIPNPAGNGALDKLTHCGNFGVNCSVQALSDFYNISIDYFAQINFTGFKTLIDAIGGITVYSDMEFSGDTFSYTIGYNEMNGEKALEFSRIRKGLPGGDTTRGKHQMSVLTAVIDKMSSTSTLISNYSEILDSLQDMFQTSMTSDLITDLIKMQLSDMSSWNIQSYSVTGTGSSQITYSMPGQYLSVKIPNMETVEHAQNLINRVLSGETLTASDMELPEN